MRLLLTADPEIEVPPRLYGGIERIVDVLVRRLKAMGHRVGLVAREGSTTPADVFYPWPGKSSLSRGDTLANMWALWKAKRDFRPDLLHSFSRIAYLAPAGRSPLEVLRNYQDVVQAAGGEVLFSCKVTMALRIQNLHIKSAGTFGHGLTNASKANQT